jgi:chromosome segregation ATPase
MAITKTIEIEVNSSQAAQSVENLTTAIDQNDQAVKSLKQQYKEAAIEVQKLAEEFGATSKQVTEAAKRAADLKDRIEDSNDAIAAFKGEGAFNATAKAVGAVASGFSAVQGALALAGAQSEEFEKTMVRLQGAMALAQGLQGLEDVGRSFAQLKTVAVNALNGIKSAIGATGIGLLVIALGAIVTYWDDIKSAVNGVSAEQEQLNAKVDANLKMEQEKLNSIGSQDNVLRLQGKSEKDILKLKIGQIDAVIKATEAQIQQNDITSKAQIAAAQRNKDILIGIVRFLQIPLRMVLETVDAVGSALGKDFGLIKGLDKLTEMGANLFFDPKEEAAKAEEVRQNNLKAIAKLKNDKAAAQISINNMDKQAADKSKEIANKKNQDEADALLKQSEILKAGREENLKMQDQSLNDLKEWGAKKLAENQKINDDQIAANKAAADAEVEIEKRKTEAKLALLNAVSGGLSLAAEELGESTTAGKAAAVAAASISTYTAIAGQLAAFSNVPVPGYAIAQAILTGAQGLLQVKKILSVKVPKSKGSAGSAPSIGGAGGGGSAPTAAPQFNVIGNTGANQLAQTLVQQPPVQAYVVANNVTTAQSLNRNIIRNASIG